jgi:replicative DNA helicase
MTTKTTKTTNSVLPPCNVEAEEAVLGSILVDPDCLADVAAVIQPGDFFREKNGWVFEAMLSLGDGVDQITVAQELAVRGRLEAVGGAAYLGLLVERVPSSVYADDYAQIVAHLSLCRRVITAAGQIGAVGYQMAADPLDKALEILAQTNGVTQTRVVEPYANAEAMARRYTAPPETRDNGVPFGFRDIDAATGNMFGGEQVIFGGATSMGKTQVIMGMALANVKAGVPVLYVSSEMQLAQWDDRVVSMETGMDVLYVRRRRFSLDQERRVQDVIGRVAQWPLYFLPTSSFHHASRMARQLVNLRGIRLIIMDYLQQFSQGLGKAGGISPYERVSYVSRGIKELAMDLNVPIIAVSSLSRELRHRESKWPMLSDLRESGNIESDADLVMFVHRPGYYMTKRAGEEDDSTYITINKQRQGGHLRLGSDKEGENKAIPLQWDGTKYTDVEPEMAQGRMV